MAGTNIFAIKRYLFGWLATAPALAEGGIQVAYAWPGSSLDRECVYGGKASAEHQYAALTSARKPRDERALIYVHIEVVRPGVTVEETDARAGEIGEVLETMLADNPTLGGVIPGLRYGGISMVETDYSMNDEAVESNLIYQIAFSSRLL